MNPKENSLRNSLSWKFEVSFSKDKIKKMFKIFFALLAVHADPPEYGINRPGQTARVIGGNRYEWLLPFIKSEQCEDGYWTSLGFGWRHFCLANNSSISRSTLKQVENNKARYTACYGRI